MKHTLKYTLLAALILMAGCTSMKRELGVGRNSPDEFTVVKRAPLTLPPDYTLRAPVDGSLQASTDASDVARKNLLGGDDSGGQSGAADASLLTKMNAGHADPDVRDKINRENGYIALKNRTLADKLIFWKDADPSDAKTPGSVVDPTAEAARLK